VDFAEDDHVGALSSIVPAGCLRQECGWPADLPAALLWTGSTRTGTTGFDVVSSCEQLQVGDADGLVKNRHKKIIADHEFALAA